MYAICEFYIHLRLILVKFIISFRITVGVDNISNIAWKVSHPDLRANPNARIHVRQDQVTHMHRLSEYQNTV
jgi:hypothetical protein